MYSTLLLASEMLSSLTCSMRDKLVFKLFSRREPRVGTVFHNVIGNKFIYLQYIISNVWIGNVG